MRKMKIAYQVICWCVFGMIKKCSNRIYMIMPMGKKVLSKVENIIREEMDAKDAQELLMPKH